MLEEVVAVMILPRSPPLISSHSRLPQLDSALLKMSVKNIKYQKLNVTSKVLSDAEFLLVSLGEGEGGKLLLERRIRLDQPSLLVQPR